MTSSSLFDSMLYGGSAGYDASPYGRRSAYYASSPYSSGYSTTYGSSYGSSSSSSSTPSSRLSSASNAYYGYFDDSLKRDRYSTTSRGGTGSDYGTSGSSRYSTSLSSYTPRYLMSSDLLDIQKSKNDILRSSSYVGGSGSRISDGGNKYDRLGRKLSNYDRWKMQQSGSSSDSTDLTSPSSDTSTTTIIPITTTTSTSGRRKKRNVGVRFADAAETRTFENDDDDDNVSALREMSMGPVSSSSSSYSGLRGSRSLSLRPELTSSSSYKPSFGSSSLFSSSSSSPTCRSLPSGVADKLSAYDVQDVKGDGGCYYRCLSLYFTGSEGNYMKYRREVMDYIRQNLDNYSTMIRSELSGSSRSTSDYFQRKTRADRQDWAETTEIIATCCVYNINVHVLALVPGRYATWEWLHFDPSIGTGRPSRASRDVHLYNAGSVHFMLCTPK